MIYIRNIPKDLLLFELWQNARLSPILMFCKETEPVLTIELARYALNNMIANNDSLSVCTFYGKPLYIDITGDFMDPDIYDTYNGKNLTSKVVDKLKKNILDKCLIRHITAK